MYNVNPNRIYAVDRALSDARCVERMHRIVRGIGRDPSSVTVIREDQLPGIIRENGWIGEVRQGAYKTSRDPDLIFTTFRWPTPEQHKQIAEGELFKRCVNAHDTYGDCAQWFLGSRVSAMLGVAPIHHYEQRPQWDSCAHVCWSLNDLHSAWGCFHRCAYCQRGSVYVIMLNVEEFLGRVKGLLAEYPWQKTFRYDVEQDVLAIEPEYGACKLLVDEFARLDGRYLILFTKSANVDFLLPLKHGGKTIMLWTMNTHTATRRYEPKTGTMEQRIEAARKCQEAGYPVRFKFKPIIPIKGWRKETTEMLELLFSRVRPENLSIETVFFDSVAEMDAALGLENLDERFVAAAVEAEKTKADWDRTVEGCRPFPHEVKEEIYRHFIREARRISPSTPTTLCAETRRMWDALADELDSRPWNYVCNCGPHCTPGMRQIDKVEGPDAERIELARAAGAVPAHEACGAKG